MGLSEPFYLAFRFQCRKCLSTNVVLNLQESQSYSEESQTFASVSMGCNDCKQNDVSQEL